MKQSITHSFSKLFSILSSTILFGGLALLLSDCFLKQHRTTMIYGTVTDPNGQPVDSILVIVQGVKDFKYVIQKETFSDKNGDYELVVEMPKEFSSAGLAIPFVGNPKFTTKYLGFNLSKNGIKTSSCCSAIIGEKTKYDFQLIPK
ncbi:MAG: carboxypeptidase-like regulatory domain-containing protein [Dyadobacter sp.]|uniref:carboxypeptidase-like regulatory domain-containing protein n=1 Tax=Dyadobacter sp. TaxID=1914288 RepID=UPI003264330C